MDPRPSSALTASHPLWSNPPAVLEPNYLFSISVPDAEQRAAARVGYYDYSGKDGRAVRYIRSAVDADHGLSLDPTNPMERVIIELIDTPVVQRLKHVTQLSTASWVYPDGIHSRFGHSVGSAVLAAATIRSLRARATEAQQREIDQWGPISVAFAMLHDVGHIAPGSHVAHDVWFPDAPDCHEEVSHALVRSDPGLRVPLDRVLGSEGLEMLDRLVDADLQDRSVPPWAWQLITAGGWNVDRGDWVRRDSRHCGIQNGEYDLPIIQKNLSINGEGELVIKEAGVSALASFFHRRADMYLNVYQHPVCRVGQHLHVLLGRRVRELFSEGKLEFADGTLQSVLAVTDGRKLGLGTVMNMTEFWWQYHVSRWCTSGDATLRALATAVLRREPFKRFKATPQNRADLLTRVEAAGLDPKYFFVEMEPSTVKLAKDLASAIKVLQDDGLSVPLASYSPVMAAFNGLEQLQRPGFLAVPQSIFANLRRH